jgi:hypothetical protein
VGSGGGLSSGISWRRETAICEISPADQFAFLFVFRPVNLAAGKAMIENGKRSVASSAGRPIRYPDLSTRIHAI